ncbi:MAG: 2-hydroxychromene-2-carboxylate isomerase, partial [Alphaproteobacteria bacterium]|nr:2-hydroxychromene-2-carboxylate isomerase [Alphaproteobacteria bacterium]
NAEIIWKPVLLGGLFKATGNMSPIMIAPKGKHMFHDLAIFIRKYEVNYKHNPHFPINTIGLMRGASAYEGDANFAKYIATIFQAIWVGEKNMGDPEVVGAVLSEAGFDPVDFVERINDPVVKDKLKTDTEAAVERGLFGTPTMFVGKKMFFGQDRLHFVAEALGVNICDVVPKFIEA